MDQLDAFSQERLGGRPIPSDVRPLLEAQWRGDDLHDPGVAFLAPGETHPLVDHSYLNDDDRADLDIMANIAAIDEVNRYVGYVAHDLDGGLIGYWFPSRRAGGSTGSAAPVRYRGTLQHLARHDIR